MEKLLVIPHVAKLNVRVRSHEIAKQLTDKYEVYYFHWTEAFGKNRGFIARHITQLWSELNQAFGRCRDFNAPGDKLNYVSAPMLFRPAMGRLKFNRWGIQKLCCRYGISRILNASGSYHITGGISGITGVYDMVDDHASLASPRSKPVTEKVIAHEIDASDAIITISHALIDLISQRYSQQAHYVPNGVDFEQMKNVCRENVSTLRRKLGLEDKYVIGCIGNHGPWSGLGLLIDAFKTIRQRMPDAVLLIVGPGEEVEKYRDQADERIIFTGPVPPSKVSDYFHAIDVGTLSFDLLPFTENALPIKVLEYGAAGKFIIATPLKELKTLALPGVVFVPQNVEAWAEALCEIRSRSWQAEWKLRYEEFDWKRIAQKVCEVFDSCLK